MKKDFSMIKNLYDKLEEVLSKLNTAKVECYRCGACCSTPFFVTITDIEFNYIVNYMQENQIPVNFHFEVENGKSPDKRFGFSRWICPLFNRNGCSVYPARPFACRIFGHYSALKFTRKICAYKNPIIFKEPPELPLWEEYISIISKNGLKKGYIYPDSILYTLPIMEVMMQFPMPMRRWRDFNFYITRRFFGNFPFSVPMSEWSFGCFNRKNQ